MNKRESKLIKIMSMIAETDIFQHYSAKSLFKKLDKYAKEKNTNIIELSLSKIRKLLEEDSSYEVVIYTDLSGTKVHKTLKFNSANKLEKWKSRSLCLPITGETPQMIEITIYNKLGLIIDEFIY